MAGAEDGWDAIERELDVTNIDNSDRRSDLGIGIIMDAAEIRWQLRINEEVIVGFPNDVARLQFETFCNKRGLGLDEWDDGRYILSTDEDDMIAETEAEAYEILTQMIQSGVRLYER